jgi:hypothetical protein
MNSIEVLRQMEKAILVVTDPFPNCSVFKVFHFMTGVRMVE